MNTIKYSKQDLNIIIDRLSKGDIIAFPTDTVFGLACVMDVKAIKKVYIAKGRDFKKPLPMMCSSLKMISDVAYINTDAKKIIDNFMPGAITIIFNKKDYLDDYITQGLNTIGIRVPDDDWILKLIEGIGKPIMVTSANISNTGSLLKWEDVYESMNGKIDGIVTENARGELSSTIVDVTHEVKILREGPISMEEIKRAIE
ncbi:MAG: L-threonylcarbamoyladenylate synthase [Erysipelotrichaceae bacterium]|nr:L-threonylcarbamoyladenylate synthase [Erysipelotrichaceae bacterium]